MSAHDHTSIVRGCYRCELGQDEALDARADAEREAEAAWIDYRNRRSLRMGLTPRRARSQTRRREFIAGYLAAEGIES